MAVQRLRQQPAPSEWAVVMRWQLNHIQALEKHVRHCTNCDCWAGGSKYHKPCARMKFIIASIIKAFNSTVDHPEQGSIFDV